MVIIIHSTLIGCNFKMYEWLHARFKPRIQKLNFLCPFLRFRCIFQLMKYQKRIEAHLCLYNYDRMFLLLVFSSDGIISIRLLIRKLNLCAFFLGTRRDKTLPRWRGGRISWTCEYRGANSQSSDHRASSRSHDSSCGCYAEIARKDTSHSGSSTFVRMNLWNTNRNEGLCIVLCYSVCHKNIRDRV